MAPDSSSFRVASDLGQARALVGRSETFHFQFGNQRRLSKENEGSHGCFDHIEWRPFQTLSDIPQTVSQYHIHLVGDSWSGAIHTVSRHQHTNPTASRLYMIIFMGLQSIEKVLVFCVVIN